MCFPFDETTNAQLGESLLGLRSPRGGRHLANDWNDWGVKCPSFRWKINIAIGRATILNGKINYFDWAIFNSELLVITRG